MSSNDNEDMAQMAGDLMQAKMEAARASQTMTHLLQIGSFRMEVVPNKDIDIQQLFKDTIADLHNKFGDKVLEISMPDVMKATAQMQGNMHG